MIGYNCKYAPIEILSGFGETAQLINNEADNFDYSSSMLHPNMCSHAKAMLEDIHSEDHNELLFMNCCDSSRRVMDAVKTKNRRFVYSIDLPSCGNACAVERFSEDILDFIKAYEKHSKKEFDREKFLASFQEGGTLPQGKYIAVMGARSNNTLLSVAKKIFSNADILDLTCANNRNVVMPTVAENETLEEIIEKYAKALLSQLPCMRMQDIRQREMLLDGENCLGIIYNTVKFCDYYDFEFSHLKGLSVPIIRVETDFTSQSYGQLLTRLEGFAETLEDNTEKKEVKINMSGKYYVGIDSGSTSTELLALDKEGNIAKSVMVRTGANAAAGAQSALEKAGISKEEIIKLVATGYGRKNIDFADDNVTEITCHARGAKHLFPEVRTIIDIGGQDSKVISLDENGKVTNFVMNDKCAAGTGRFLENMAKVLELNIDDMAEIGLKYKNDLTISSMCTVFAESEVVSLIAENHSVPDIVHGLNKSVAVKTNALAKSAKDFSFVIMTGGVARNKGVVSELEKQLKTTLHIPEQPEFCGALGAALIAAEK